MRYYIDTCVWIDFVEGKGYAKNIFIRILTKGDYIIISDILAKEFLRYEDFSEIKVLFELLKRNIIKIKTSALQDFEAQRLKKEKQVPEPDALHSILARDNGAILMTTDAHFRKLTDVCPILFP